MKIGINNYNLSFEKQLKAKANIINNGKPEQCFIYKLNKEEDSDYFLKLNDNPIWWEEGFCKEVCQTVQNDEPSEHVYVMEDSNEECLGFIEIDDDVIFEEYQRVEYLETYSPYSSKNEDRNRKYIGQTLLAFAAKTFNKRHKIGLLVPVAVQGSWGFYIDKCNFRQNKYSPVELLLKKRDFNKLIKANESNTKGKIELVGE